MSRPLNPPKNYGLSDPRRSCPNCKWCIYPSEYGGEVVRCRRDVSKEGGWEEMDERSCDYFKEMK